MVSGSRKEPDFHDPEKKTGFWVKERTGFHDPEEKTGFWVKEAGKSA